MADELAALRNLGPKSQAMLAAAGITTSDELRRLGSVAAYARVMATRANASLNLLWAIEGALCGRPWQVVAKEHRTSLLLALDSHQQQDNAPC
jgi:DNA transformation protein